MALDWYNGVMASCGLVIPVPEQTTHHSLDKEVAFLEKHKATTGKSTLVLQEGTKESRV